MTDCNTTKKIHTINKEEAYTYDELDFIHKIISTTNKLNSSYDVISKKIETLKSAIVQNKTSQAIFFMPKNTFDIFSLIQGQKAICQIELKDVETLEKLCNSMDGKTFAPEGGLFSHIQKKIHTLLNFLKSGNTAYPVTIQVDM